jgi:hypothetical protein
VGESVYPSTNLTAITIRFKISGAYQASLYATASLYNTTGTATAYAASAATSILLVNLNQTNALNSSANFVCYIYNPASTSVYKACNITGQSSGTAAVLANYITSGWYAGTGALTGVRFLPISGNINGTFRLYGIKTS